MALYTFFLVTLAFNVWPKFPIDDPYQCGDFYELCQNIQRRSNGTFAEYGKALNDALASLKQMSGIYSEEDAAKLKPIFTQMLKQLEDKQHEQMQLEPFIKDLMHIGGMGIDCNNLLIDYNHKLESRVNLDWNRSLLMTCMARVQNQLCHFERLDAKLAKIHQLVWPFNKSDIIMANEVRKTLKECKTSVRRVKEWAMAEVANMESISALKEVMDTQEMVKVMRAWVNYLDSDKPLSYKIRYTEEKIEFIKGLPNTQKQLINMERTLNDLKAKYDKIQIEERAKVKEAKSDEEKRNKEKGNNNAWDEDFNQPHYPKGKKPVKPVVESTPTIPSILTTKWFTKPNKELEKEKLNRKLEEERRRIQEEKREEDKRNREKGTNKAFDEDEEEPSKKGKGFNFTPRRRQTRDLSKTIEEVSTKMPIVRARPTMPSTIKRIIDSMTSDFKKFVTKIEIFGRIPKTTTNTPNIINPTTTMTTISSSTSTISTTQPHTTTIKTTTPFIPTTLPTTQETTTTSTTTQPTTTRTTLAESTTTDAPSTTTSTTTASTTTMSTKMKSKTKEGKPKETPKRKPKTKGKGRRPIKTKIATESPIILKKPTPSFIQPPVVKTPFPKITKRHVPEHTFITEKGWVVKDQTSKSTVITYRPWTVLPMDPTTTSRIGRKLESTTEDEMSDSTKKDLSNMPDNKKYIRASTLTATVPRIFFDNDRSVSFGFNDITDFKQGNGHDILQKILSGAQFFAEYPTYKSDSSAASTTDWVYPMREESGKKVALTPCHILSTHDHYCVGVLVKATQQSPSTDLDRNHYRPFITNMDICTEPCRPKKKFATRVVASTAQICDVGDIEVDFPIMPDNSAGEVTLLHHSVQVQGATAQEVKEHDMVVAIRHIHLCFIAHCEIEVIPAMNGLTFKFTSSGTAMWEYAAGEHHDHGILHAQSVMYNIELPEWGDITYFLRCNKNSERNTKTFSKHEYCRSYSYSWEFWFCMNQNYVWFIFCAFLASVLVHFFSCWIAAILGYIVCFFWAFFKPCLKKKACMHCGRVRIADKIHLCPSSCDYCGIKMDPEHFKNCALGKEHTNGYIKTWRSTLSWGFVSVYASGIKKYIIYAIMGFVWVGIIASLPGTIKGESSSISTVSVENEIIDLVKNHGFTLTKGLMKRGEFTRQGLTVTSASKECDGDTDCKLTTQLQTRLRVEPDYQAGFLLTKPGLPTLQHKFDIRVHNTWDVYDIVFQYYGCESRMIPHNADTCTEPSPACFKKLESYASVGNHSLDGTSSWSCDGWGCASISQGSTCMKCNHAAVKSTCMPVHSLGTRTSIAEICYVVQNQGACKNFTRSSQITDAEFGFMLDDEPDYITDTTQFAIRRGFPVRGSINPKDMFATRFSSIQYDKDYNPSCHPDIRADHMCLFGEHRWFKVHRCCKNTYGYNKDLVVQPHWHVYGQKLFVEGPKLGMATVAMVLAGIDVSSIIEGQEVNMFVISSMTGCYNCHIGGLMTITVSAMRNGPTTMTCDVINVKHGDFSLKSGSNDYHFHFTSNNQGGSVTCTIVGKVAKYTIDLEDPPKTYHGDSTINSKSTYDNGDDCDDSTLCQFTQGFVNFFDFITGPWWVTTLKVIAIIVVSFFLIWVLYKIIKWAAEPKEMSKLESTKSLFKQEKKMKNI